MDNTIHERRLYFSKVSLGISSDSILHTLLDTISGLNLPPHSKILDLGCGNGELLKKLRHASPEFCLHGIDLFKFGDFREIDAKFFLHDLNIDFPMQLERYDLIIASHVLIYLENSWHFIREVSRLLNPGKKLVISNPNTESIRNLSSYVLRGYHSHCPLSYPGHINAPSVAEMQRILEKESLFEIDAVHYIPEGRMPKSTRTWQSIFPMLQGKRFSDSYCILASRSK